jgi:branched-chain amino acid transport system ATP-binding protein
MVGRHVRSHQGVFGAIFRHKAARAEEASIRSRAEELLDFVGIGQFANRTAKFLSYGDQRRLEIARALATEPRLLLLDEALAGLTPAEVRAAIELVRRIHARGITIVLVEHIMEVILTLAARAVVFHQGRVIAAGPPRQVVADPAVIDAYLGHRASKAITL